METAALITGPLHDRHVALGATMGAFGGWSMPISYPGGTVAEHTAVRTAVGIFDVSHLGKLSVTGPGAAAFVDRCLTADLGRIAPGQAQYTLCCADDGGVVDDLIAYLVEPGRRAARAERGERGGGRGAAAGGGAGRGRGGRPAPRPRGARRAGAAGGGGAGHGAARGRGPRGPGRTWRSPTWPAIRVCRTGYTGEHGYELLVPADDAGAVWDALLAAAAPLGGRPCGLGARDTLRTEMGYPLHGQDLSGDITPVQAGSGWAVGWRKPEFWGRDALVAEKEAGPARRLRGLRATGRGVPRPGMTVLTRRASRVGVTTSGTFSPTLKAGIALALIDTASGVDARTTRWRSTSAAARCACTVVKPPFVPSHVR